MSNNAKTPSLISRNDGNDLRTPRGKSRPQWVKGPFGVSANINGRAVLIRRIATYERGTKTFSKYGQAWRIAVDAGYPLPDCSLLRDAKNAAEAFCLREDIKVLKHSAAQVGYCNACTERERDSTVTEVSFRSMSFRLCDNCRIVLKALL